MTATYTRDDLDGPALSDVERVRAEMRARREAMLRERIRALHAVNRMPARQIAAIVGVSIGYVETATGEKFPPEGLS